MRISRLYGHCASVLLCASKATGDEGQAAVLSGHQNLDMAPRDFSLRWRDHVDDAVAEPNEFAGLLRRTARQLEDGRDADPGFVHAVTQPWGHRRYDFYDAAAVMKVRNLHLLGHIAVARLRVGRGAGRDRDTEENRALLAAIDGGYNVEFAGGPGECDGTFSWSGWLDIGQELDDGTPQRVLFPPGGVPLEVGFTDPETTLGHIARAGGVARWPYDVLDVWLFLAVTKTASPSGAQCLNAQVVTGDPVEAV